MALSKPTHYSTDVNAADSSAAFLVKSLLYPVTAVLWLGGCLLAWDEQLYGPYCLVAVLAFVGVADLFDVTRLRSPPRGAFALRSVADIWARWILVVGFIWIVLHLSGLTTVNTEPLRFWAVTTPFVLWISDYLAHFVLLRGHSRATSPRRAIIVGVTELGSRLERTLGEDLSLRTEVVGFCEDRGPERITASHRARLLGGTGDLSEFVTRHRVNVVYITIPMSRDPRITAILGALRDSTASVYFVPDLFVFNLIQGRFDIVDGIPLVAVCESPFFGIRGVAKRVFDMLIAAAAIAVLSPVMLAVAVGVRLTSSGPALFRQTRYGLDGKEITVYKFRSMKVTEEGRSHFVPVARGDARVTRFGAFIRSTSLDELPQLFNVLGGSMSIVGPRPHVIAVNEQYRRLIPSYMVRHKVKPGITGWAQVNGYRGSDSLESMQKRVEFDLEYLQHWSLGLDLMILMKTATLVLRDERAF
jgi:putative colanic acid biosynthesis UDP-glucose lipid carrier transferase